jgi:serine/threonine-protein kinase HipA
MPDDNRCLLCYKRLGDGMKNYHSLCSRKFFEKNTTPLLPYRLDELQDLAKNVVQRSITIPGVQAKLSMYLAKRGSAAERLTLVGLWGNYILKPPVKKYPQMPEVEDMTMHLARFFKIETVPHGLIPLQSGELAYLTRRIDRKRTGEKMQMEDMCQLTERLTEDKYKGSMEQIAGIIRRFSSNSGLDIVRFFEVALFSFLTGNADMHLKNFSLLRDKQDFITLSPAYDMLSTRLLIPERDDPEELALTLNGKKSNFKQKDFFQFGKTIGLDEKQMANSLKRFAEGFKSAFAFIDDSLLTSGNKAKLKEILQERSARLQSDLV